MLRFKNKFKLTSSNQEDDNSSIESHKTVSGKSSGNNLTEDLSNLSVQDNTSHNSTPANTNTSTNSQSTSSSSANSSSSSVNKQSRANTPKSNGNNTSSGSSGESINRPTKASNPGLLTVKIYNSNDIQLPIKINNHRQILTALASNSNNSQTSNELIKSINKLDDSEEYLEPQNSSNYLPSIISIPNNNDANLIKSLLYLTIEFENNALIIEPQKGTINNSIWNQVVSFDVTKALNSSDSSSNFLNLNLFIRLPNILIPEFEKRHNNHLFTNNNGLNNSGSSSGGNTSGSIGDLLIGSIKLPLNLKYHNKAIRLINHEFLLFKNLNFDVNKILGEVMLTIDFKPIVKSSLSINDFDLLKVIGKGSFGKVMQVIKKDTKQIYALKTLRKQHIISRMEVTHTLAERTVLAKINNPFIVPLKFSFQSPEKLYLVLSFINGGELFWHLQREGKFSMDRSRFYIAELLTALESLHELNVIYRDLKPENILLDYQGHIALCDFGLCKLNMANDDKTNTFCGTPEYLAPELLLNQGYTRVVDWWTLGTLLYEMLSGLPPFYDDDVPTMYRKILQNPLKFPSFLENTDAQDLLVQLLEKNPDKRLNDAHAIKTHRFFKDIDWNKLLNKNYLPPFKPNVDNLLDTSNFDQDFTSENPQDSVVDDFLSESVQKQFGGWTYNGDNILP